MSQNATDLLAGEIIFGAGDFRFISLSANGDVNDRAYAVSGAPNPDPLDVAEIQSYFLLADRQQSERAGTEVTLPFLNPAVADAIPVAAYSRRSQYPIRSAELNSVRVSRKRRWRVPIETPVSWIALRNW